MVKKRTLLRSIVKYHVGATLYGWQKGRRGGCHKKLINRKGKDWEVNVKK